MSTSGKTEKDVQILSGMSGKTNMSNLDLTVVSLFERGDLLEEMNRIGGAAWPEFMLYDPVAIAHWMELVDAFSDCQLMLMDGERIAAIINSVPLSFTADLADLPDEGVDWGVKRALSDHNSGLVPNMLMGVQVVVDEDYSGRGLSSFATSEMLNLARDKKLDGLIVPLRPSNKHLFPLIDMCDYIQWKNDDGQPFDNWLRVHARAGGTVVGVCTRSMYIPGKVNEWEQWTGQIFPGSGSYIVPGALCPVEIDLDRNIGSYTEPNIWIHHRSDC